MYTFEFGHLWNRENKNEYDTNVNIRWTDGKFFSEVTFKYLKDEKTVELKYPKEEELVGSLDEKCIDKLKEELCKRARIRALLGVEK